MIQEAMKKALKYLSVRLRSEYEMRQYLQQKGYNEDIIEEVIRQLKTYSYIDDYAYAGAFVRDKVNFNPCGSKKIYMELKKRGVSNLCINQALAENLPAETEVELAKKVLAKYKETDREKNLRYLLGKGFTYHAAREAWQAKESIDAETY